MRYITPEHCVHTRLAGRPAPRWPAALLVFRDHPGSQKALQHFGGVRPVRYRLLYNLTHSELEPVVFEADLAGRTLVILTRLVWGGPQTAIVVEELASLGVGLFVGYGVAGSIDPDLLRGSLVVAESALATDGTSRAYGAAGRVQADPELLRRTMQAAEAASHEVRPVCAATVDALYRETPELLGEFARQGARIVNMETAPLYAVAAACGVRSVWCGCISDCLTGPRWDDWFPDIGSGSDAAIRLCFGLLEEGLR